MGCLVALLAAISPRLVIFLLWIFTDRLTIAFRSGWEGIIGFVLLPYTTLFYALVYEPGRGSTRSGGSSWPWGSSSTCPRTCSAAAPVVAGIAGPLRLRRSDFVSGDISG